MDNKIFIDVAKIEVCKYHNNKVDTLKEENEINRMINKDDVFVVWSCKTLQNSKVLLSTPLPDGMYYEVTYNGDKNEIYFDAYKKEKKKCIKIEEG